jgi:hypothetical protein
LKVKGWGIWREFIGCNLKICNCGICKTIRTTIRTENQPNISKFPSSRHIGAQKADVKH